MKGVLSAFEGDREGVTFMKLKRGIRFSAMPAFGGRLSDDDLWRVTALLRQMDKLPTDVAREWPSARSDGLGAIVLLGDAPEFPGRR